MIRSSSVIYRLRNGLTRYLSFSRITACNRHLSSHDEAFHCEIFISSSLFGERGEWVNTRRANNNPPLSLTSTAGYGMSAFVSSEKKERARVACPMHYILPSVAFE